MSYSKKKGDKSMQGEKFTLMQYNISAILGFIEAGDFVIPEIQSGPMSRFSTS